MTTPVASSPVPIETEFKLLARQPLEIAAVDAALRELGMACRLADNRRHEDTYFDDDRGSLWRTGVGLRIRQDRTGRRLNCKAAADVQDGLFVRAELEAPWPSGRPPADAADLPAELRDHVEPFTLSRPLRPSLRLEVQREIRVLQQDGRDLCELAIDRATVHGGGRTAQFQEIEIEVHFDLARNQRLAEELAARLPLVAAAHDKPAHARMLLGDEPRVADLRPEPAERMVADSIALRATRWLHAMRRAEVGVRRDEDPTHLHAMRVALRRLRSLVSAFASNWPTETSARLEASLAETGRQLGALRDLDVMLDTLPADVEALPARLRAPGQRAAHWVLEQREQARHRLHDWLRSPARLTAAAALDDEIAGIETDTPAARAPVAEAARGAIAKAASRLRKRLGAIESALPIGPAHQVRLAAKRVRYLAEEFAEVPGLRCRDAIRPVSRLQQAIGNLCDHEGASERLLGWVPAMATGADGAASVAALGALAMHHKQATKAARKRVRKALERVDRKRLWRELMA